MVRLSGAARPPTSVGLLQAISAIQTATSRLPDGTATAKAMDYSLQRWGALTRYLNDPALPIDDSFDE